MRTATTNYTVRLSVEDKKRAERVFKALGMTLSTGVNIYIKMVCREQKIPFDLTVNEHLKLKQTKPQMQRHALDDFLQTIASAGPLGDEFDKAAKQGLNLRGRLRS